MTPLESKLRNWTTVCLDDFCVTSSGGTPSRDTPAFYENGTIPWVKSGELSQKIVTETSERITAEALENSSAKMVKKGAILVAMYGATVGQIAILGIDAATNQAVCAIEPDPARCLPRFLYYSLVQKVPELLQMRVGGAQPNISQKLIRDLKFDLPRDLREQARIVELLDQADVLRRQRAEADAKLARLLPALFRHHFGKTDSPSVPLSALADTTSGGTPNRNEPKYFGGSIPWVKSGELSQIEVSVTEETITQEALQNSSAKLMPAGTVLLAMYGATVGAVAQLKIPAATNQAVCCISPLPGVDPDFLFAALRIKAQSLVHQRVGGAQPNVSQGIVRQLRMPDASPAKQISFGKQATQLMSLESQAAASAAKLETLFQTLLHRAFTGELTARWREAHLREGVQEMTRLSRA